MDRSLIEEFLATSEAAAKVARDELVRAKAQMAHAQDKHDESKSSTSRRAVADATIDLESAERVARKCEDGLEQSRIALARLEREERLAQYESGKAEVTRLMGVAREGIGAVIQVDRALDQAVKGAIVQPVSRALEVYNGIESLARDLGLTSDLDRNVRRPNLADMRLLCSREVTKARAKDQRDPLLAFVEHADLSWQNSDATASDLEDREKWANRPQWTPGTAAIAEAIAARVPAPVAPAALVEEGDPNAAA